MATNSYRQWKGWSFMLFTCLCGVHFGSNPSTPLLIMQVIVCTSPMWAYCCHPSVPLHPWGDIELTIYEMRHTRDFD
jgi:hypothetical protein